MTIFAGTRILASNINNGFGLYAPKNANQSVASSTVLQNDTALFLALQANKTYEFALRVLYNGIGGGGGEMKFGWSVPAGTTMQWGLNYAVAPTLGLALVYGTQSSVLAGGANGTANPLPLWMEGFVTTAGTAGNLQFQWAQNTSNATATTVMIGSRLIAWDQNFI